jgi:uncharacterized protein
MVRTCAKLFERILANRETFCFGILVILLSSTLYAQPAHASIGYTSPGNPAGYVTDFAKVLSANEVQSIDAELQQFEASTSNQIAVVTVPDMNGDYIEDYAPKLFAQWGIGQKDKDNGVLLLLSTSEHAIRIEVGYGLEGALPDSVAQAIINNDLTPNLKAGNYDAGVTAAVSDIMLATQNEYVGTGSTNSGSNDTGSAWGAGIFLAFIALQWLAAILARSKSWWAGGIVGAVIGFGVWGFFSFAIVWGFLAVAGLTGSGLLFDYFVSKHYNAAKANGARMPWWIGGGWGGGRGGGFGGFGGGMSGGGGASGGW